MFAQGIKQLVKKEVRIYSLKFASLLVKRNQEENTQSIKKEFYPLKKVYLGVENILK